MCMNKTWNEMIWSSPLRATKRKSNMANIAILSSCLAPGALGVSDAVCLCLRSRRERCGDSLPLKHSRHCNALDLFLSVARENSLLLPWVTSLHHHSEANCNLGLWICEEYVLSIIKNQIPKGHNIIPKGRCTIVRRKTLLQVRIGNPLDWGCCRIHPETSGSLGRSWCPRWWSGKHDRSILSVPKSIM